jgi:hypothetical protein
MALLSGKSLINGWTLKEYYCFDDYTEKDRTLGAYTTETLKNNGIEFKGMVGCKQDNNI